MARFQGVFSAPVFSQCCAVIEEMLLCSVAHYENLPASRSCATSRFLGGVLSLRPQTMLIRLTATGVCKLPPSLSTGVSRMSKHTVSYFKGLSTRWSLGGMQLKLGSVPDHCFCFAEGKYLAWCYVALGGSCGIWLDAILGSHDLCCVWWYCTSGHYGLEKFHVTFMQQLTNVWSAVVCVWDTRCDWSLVIPNCNSWKPECETTVNNINIFVNTALRGSSDAFVIGFFFFSRMIFHDKRWTWPHAFLFWAGYLSLNEPDQRQCHCQLHLAIRKMRSTYGFNWNPVIKQLVEWCCEKDKAGKESGTLGTAGLRRPLLWHGYETARWFSVSTITTLSTSLKWHCPGGESTFFGSRSDIAKQHWESWHWYTGIMLLLFFFFLLFFLLSHTTAGAHSLKNLVLFIKPWMWISLSSNLTFKGSGSFLSITFHCLCDFCHLLYNNMHIAQLLMHCWLVMSFMKHLQHHISPGSNY